MEAEKAQSSPSASGDSTIHDFCLVLFNISISVEILIVLIIVLLTSVKHLYDHYFELFIRSVAGLDKEADLVHMEVRTADGYAHYLTCRIQECAETTRSGPFARSIDISSLVVQDEYIFIQVTTGGRASYYVSYRREAFTQIKLPKYSLPKDMHIISTDENQVFAAVQEWNQNDTYNLYISDVRGIYFTLAMENIKSSRGLMGNIIIELYE
uniref:VPS10 domain-containing receptor SorCS3-like n=1 Tax=Halichoerus grypus TaxID=9711 RepID=UPI001659FC22